jgi:hypothetical protein
MRIRILWPSLSACGAFAAGDIGAARDEEKEEEIKSVFCFLTKKI